MFQEWDLYRATGVVLVDLKPDAPLQVSLFEDPLQAERSGKTYRAIDALNQK